ncbi:MAG: hypothetical protein NTU53_22760 [Planctomycetota bacterium]|nr:hypothetical protein [Planctomycetota bacterium]
MRLVLFETPNSDVVRAEMPQEAYDMYGRAVDRLTGDEKMTDVSLKQVGVKLSDAQFFDPVHLNREGAEQFSRALAERAVVPALGGRLPEGK